MSDTLNSSGRSLSPQTPKPVSLEKRIGLLLQLPIGHLLPRLALYRAKVKEIEACLASLGAWDDRPKVAPHDFPPPPGSVPVFEKQLAGAVQDRLPLVAPLDGYVLSFPPTAGEPKWVSVLQSAMQNPATLAAMGMSPAALALIRRNGNTFVLTFGHAWQKLEDDWLEPEFGRRVALNAIPPDNLVEIHVEQVFAKWHVARERAPRASSVEEFGVF